jgi:hypothetical protein
MRFEQQYEIRRANVDCESQIVWDGDRRRSLGTQPETADTAKESLRPRPVLSYSEPGSRDAERRADG